MSPYGLYAVEKSTTDEKNQMANSIKPTSDQGLPASEHESRFRKLAKTWKQETAHLSSTVRMANHPAYREIIALGPAAVPLILAELCREPDFCFAALREITGENPVPSTSAGKVAEMAGAWIEWGRTRGLIE